MHLKSKKILSLISLIVGLSSCNGSESITLLLTAPSNGLITNSDPIVKVNITEGTPDRVDLLVDGEKVFTFEGLYETTWKTQGYRDGQHTLAARAWKSTKTYLSPEITLTLDKTSPTLVTSSPVDEGELAEHDLLRLTFSEAITGPESAFEVTNTAGAPVSIQEITWEENGKVAKIQLDDIPPSNEKLTLTMKAGLQDFAGNPMSEIAIGFYRPPWLSTGLSANLNSAGSTVLQTKLAETENEELWIGVLSQTTSGIQTLQLFTKKVGHLQAMSSVQLTGSSSTSTPWLSHSPNANFAIGWKHLSGATIRVFKQSEGTWTSINFGTGDSANQELAGLSIDENETLYSLGLDKEEPCARLHAFQWKDNDWKQIGTAINPENSCAEGTATITQHSNTSHVAGWFKKSAAEDAYIDLIALTFESNWAPKAEIKSTSAITQPGPMVFRHAPDNSPYLAWELSGKLGANLLTPSGSIPLYQNQLNVRVDENHAKLTDLIFGSDNTPYLIFSDYTDLIQGPALERSYWIKLSSTGNPTHLHLPQKIHPEAYVLFRKNGDIILSSPQTDGVALKLQNGTPKTNPSFLTAENTACGLLNEAGLLSELLSDTGCFTDISKRTVVPEAIPYDVNSALWSDGTAKERYLILPKETNIQRTDKLGWIFPVGTILIKQFNYPFDINNPELGLKPVETRFMLRQDEGWKFFSYIWNDESTDATRRDLEAEETATFTLGVGLTYLHKYPSESQCIQCHGTKADNSTRGLSTLQMNRNVDYGSSIVNQLTAFHAAGIFDNSVENLEPTALNSLTDQSDVTQDLGHRARSYLHSNCAHCHYDDPENPATKSFCGDMAYLSTSSLKDADLCSRIVPGDAEASILYQAMRNVEVPNPFVGARQMPQVGVRVLDQKAIALIKEWIESLPADVCDESFQIEN
ncbi:MAG: Ig-like domain-containing protein [Myxococcota bacterium]|nr:Ig-like domain-containing protein [Myxococcota bacterium]